MRSAIHGAAAAVLRRADGDGEELNCGSGGGADTYFGLRIASIFIILIGSTFGATFPVIARRSRLKNVIPGSVFDFAKYFGSGVIIATAFIHLLDPALDALGSECLTGAWQDYPWALALCMLSIFLIFFAELIAFRWGTRKLASLGITYDAHGHGGGASHAAHGPEPPISESRSVQKSTDNVSDTDSSRDIEKANSASKPVVQVAGQSSHVHDGHDHSHAQGHGVLDDSAVAQIIGIFVLEFGVVLHSILIGLTLAVDEDFKVLFVVLVFHQTFEGLGLGSRLAFLKLPPQYSYIPYAAAILYGLTTPIGIAAGLGVRTTYNPGSAKASAVSGVMDSLSAGILIYTGLVELLAHEFLFSSEMRAASEKRLFYACICMLLGAGLMALLGRWA